MIWWDRINGGKTTKKDEIIRQQDIAYLDYKHKKRSWHLHKNLAIFVHTWAFNHLNDVFYFPNVNEVDGIKVPFTIENQILSQLQSMVSFGDNGAISIDATFNTNDVKFHLFTLMVFNVSECQLHGSLQVTKHVMIWWSGLKSFKNNVSKENA